MECLTRAAAAALVLGLSSLAAPAVAAPPRLYATPAPIEPADPSAEVVLRALSLLGVNYRFGGNTPDTGLDCSGLVRFVFHETLGMPLPRRSEEISRVGSVIPARDLQPGDLVFFNTLRRAFSHVGIYIGNNQFVHAPATGKSVRIENLGADYWTRRFNGARRLLDGNEPDGPGLFQADALIAAGLIPGPAAAANAGRATLTRTAAPVATRAGARATGSSVASILPPFDRRGLGNDLTLN